MQGKKKAAALPSLQIQVAISSNHAVLGLLKSGVLLLLNAVGQRSSPDIHYKAQCVSAAS